MSRFFYYLVATTLFSVVIQANALLAAENVPVARAIPVTALPASMETVFDPIEAVGTLRANETVTLTTTISDTITAIHFHDGQRVKKGDILLEMTSIEERALIEQQKALVDEAFKQLERGRELVRTGAVSRAVLDQRESEYRSARSGMAALTSRLNDHVVVAPFDGVLGLRNLSVGALVQPGTKISTLDDDSLMKLDFSIPSKFINMISQGLKIQATAKGFKEPFTGIITSTDSQIDETTRSIRVRAEIQNPDRVLRPGLLMRLMIEANTRNALVIDEGAVVMEGKQAYVYVAAPKDAGFVADKRAVTLGTRTTGKVEVIDGIKANESIITRGNMALRAGQPVTPQQPGERK